MTEDSPTGSDARFPSAAVFGILPSRMEKFDVVIVGTGPAAWRRL